MKKEDELLRKLREGDEIAFTIIYNRFHRFLFVYAYKLTGDEQDASDIVQEIFTNLWIKRDNLFIQGSLIGYLHQSIRNRFLNQIRSRSVRTRYEEDLKEFLQNGKCDTDERLLERELIYRLRKLAETLPGKMGRAFILRHLCEHSIPEIAETIHVSQKTVNNLISEAKKNIQLKQT